MLLTAAEEIPNGEDWCHEVKYDGFRCVLDWEDGSVEPVLKSRNGNILNQKFPEIIDFCEEIKEVIRSYLPLTLDGELVYLTNNYKSNFSVVQTRGRMKNKKTIRKHQEEFTCHYVVFDLLKYIGKSQTNLHFTQRKQILKKLFEKIKIPTAVNYEDFNRIQTIDFYHDGKALFEEIKKNNGEGIVSKRKTSKWLSATRTTNWLKIKNWRYVSVILTKYNKINGFFHGAIYHDKSLIEVTTFRHGLTEEETNTLKELFKSNGTTITENILEIEPSICVEIACIDFAFGKLREPKFKKFNFEREAVDCHYKQMQRQLFPLPQTIQETHRDKIIWVASDIVKDDYLLYLQNISSLMLPFLRDRPLTIIRYPHGVPGESFYQKNSPMNLPQFVTSKHIDGISYMLCNNMETLLWLGNQLAIEFHIPFQTIATSKPNEIVFDLDPPENEFSLAVDAALRLKTILDQFGLQSFPKTSGEKECIFIFHCRRIPFLTKKLVYLQSLCVISYVIKSLKCSRQNG